MTRLSAQEILRKNHIRLVVNAPNGQYTETCRECGSKNLGVKTDYKDEACWLCPDCGWSGPPSAIRRALAAAGYCPIPLYGKVPPVYGKNNPRKGLAGWQDLTAVTDEQIEMWERTWPDAVNTGVLTRSIPTLDLDILNEEAARACEDLVRERHEEAGYVLVRIGLPPKRAIPFRTEEPFDKIVVNLVAPSASAEKIEFLGDGQQVVVAGIHPETKQPYRWHGGEPGKIAREELPYVRQADAQALVDDLVELLVRDFGYKRAPGRPGKGKGNGDDRGGDAGWQHLFDNIRAGRELHDSLRDLAAKMVASGMAPGAVVNALRALMDSSSVPHDARWRERYDDIPRLVKGAEERLKAGGPQPQQPQPQSQPQRTREKAPGKNDEWLPVMAKINAVLGASRAPEPPARDIDGFLTHARELVLPGLHLFTTANEQGNDADLLPAPEQYLLHRMGVVEASELIEHHIDYIGEKGKSVHLQTPYVRHYLQRHDGVLPQAVAISTLPLVLDDGTLLAPVGLDRKRGIIFKVPHQLHNILPRREECTEEAVRKAMRFLCDEWLCDVATDFTGKCTLIAAALTMIERSLLPERPCFFVTAGKSRGGKTTLLKMLIMAVTGQQAAAAAWSSDENERRKALLGYLLSGVAYVLWDNIPRGERLSCPHIERACTTSYYVDRRLGVSEVVNAAAATVHLFTGNNVGARGDLASRSLELRIDVNRPDPENREFKHPDPIGWTEHHRAETLEKLYCIMLGNPALESDKAGGTRFKTWYRLVGSAVEHAAALVGDHLNFQKLFLAREADDDEDIGTLAEALAVLHRRWPVAEFLASDIANLINREGVDANPYSWDGEEKVLREMKHDSAILRELLFPDEPNVVATAKSVGHRLKNHIDEPVQHGEDVLILRARSVRNTLHFSVSRS
jgi:bifunctional DNA primase/polymerase-like protein